MTFKQLEQFLQTEKWRAAAWQNVNMCGKYARCMYCDRSKDYPCARAYDTLMKTRRVGEVSISSWQFPEPDVKERFGTVFANDELNSSITQISIDPEDLFYFNLGGRNVEFYTQPYDGKETGGTETSDYPQTVYMSLPSGTEDKKHESKRTRIAFSNRKNREIVSLTTNEERDTRVLVIRKHVK